MFHSNKELQSARSGERRYSPGVHRSPSDKRTVEQPHSPGVGSSQSDKQALERRHSLGVRHSRFANRDRTHSSPIVNQIENLDICFLEINNKEKCLFCCSNSAQSHFSGAK